MQLPSGRFYTVEHFDSSICEGDKRWVSRLQLCVVAELQLPHVAELQVLKLLKLRVVAEFKLNVKVFQADIGMVRMLLSSSEREPGVCGFEHDTVLIDLIFDMQDSSCMKSPSMRFKSTDLHRTSQHQGSLISATNTYMAPVLLAGIGMSCHTPRLTHTT